MNEIQRILRLVSPVMTLAEAAAHLKVHPNTLRKWDNDGSLKAVRYGKRRDRRYKKDDIEKFLRDGKRV